MKFSIIIPTFNNFKYLELCINSIEENSKYKHQIIIHLNGNDEDSKNFLLKKNIQYTHTDHNVGLCRGVNMASNEATFPYILYAHDDMFFLPNWDLHLENEIIKIGHEKFYLSIAQISHLGPDSRGQIQHIQFDCGTSVENFNKKKLLDNFNKLEFRDLQGTHWAPHIVHKTMWCKIGGFSNEFDPGFGSDPDFNMKLWKEGVRVFKLLSKSRIYHFSSLTTRKNNDIVRNDGRKTFLLKWGITIDHFVKFYLRRGELYDGPLNEPIKNFSYYFDLIISKIKYLKAKFIL